MKKVLIILLITLSILLFSCDHVYPSKKDVYYMKKYYMNNENYNIVSGKIVDFFEPGKLYEKCGDSTIQGVIITFSCGKEYPAIKCYEPGECTKYFVIHSNNGIELNIDDEIEFIATGPWYRNQKNSIVQIERDSVLLLSFDEGKENLFEWLDNMTTR